MKINRSKFIQHLARISCSGQVTEVAFTEGFSVVALTSDQLLMVTAPDADGAEPLENEIGVADLNLLSRALKLLPGEGNTGIEVDVYVRNNRLVIDDGSRGMQKLLLAAPKTIGTRIEDATIEKLLALAPVNKKAVKLTRSILEGVVAAFSLYKADEVEVRIGPDGGKICVGTEKTHRAEFTLDEDVASDEEYTLLFGKHLVDVFAIITDFSSAKIRFGGPKRPALIEDGEYQYILSPKSRSAEESKPAVKKSKAAKAEKAEETETEAAEPEAPPAKPKNRRKAKAADE